MTTPQARYRITARDESAGAFRSFRNRLGGVTASLNVMRGAVIGLLGAAGIGAIGQRSLKAADEIAKLNRQTGLGTRFLSEMRGVAQLAGVEFSGIEKASRKLSESLFDAQAGIKQYADAFREAGLNPDELAKLAPDERFLKVVTAVASVADEYRRTALAADLLGGRQEALIRLGALGIDTIRELREEEVRRGNSLSTEQVAAAEAALDAQTRLKASLEGVSNTFIVRYAGAVQRASDAIRAVLLPVIEVLAQAFFNVGELVGGIANALVNLLAGNFEAAFEVAKRTIQDATDNAKTFIDVLLNPSEAAERRATERLVAAAEDAASRAREAIDRNRGGNVKPLFDDDIKSVKSLISGIRSAIAFRKELNDQQGSAAVFDTSLQSLRGGSISGDDETLRQLRLIEQRLQQKDLIKIMSDVRDILSRQGAGAALFG